MLGLRVPRLEFWAVGLQGLRGLGFRVSGCGVEVWARP